MSLLVDVFAVNQSIWRYMAKFLQMVHMAFGPPLYHHRLNLKIDDSK